MSWRWATIGEVWLANRMRSKRPALWYVSAIRGICFTLGQRDDMLTCFSLINTNE